MKKERDIKTTKYDTIVKKIIIPLLQKINRINDKAYMDSPEISKKILKKIGDATPESFINGNKNVV